MRALASDLREVWLTARARYERYHEHAWLALDRRAGRQGQHLPWNHLTAVDFDAIKAVIEGAATTRQRRYLRLERQLQWGRLQRWLGRCDQLPRHHEPARLVSAGLDLAGRPVLLTPAAARAWLKMQQHAVADGVALQAVSSFRDYDYQAALVKRKLAAGVTLAETLALVARPGYSEHHSGRALDLASINAPLLQPEFEHSSTFEWLSQNAAHHGFYLSYPKNNPTGISYEPWHWCHDGRSIGST